MFVLVSKESTYYFNTFPTDVRRNTSALKETSFFYSWTMGFTTHSTWYPKDEWGV